MRAPPSCLLCLTEHGLQCVQRRSSVPVQSVMSGVVGSSRARIVTAHIPRVKCPSTPLNRTVHRQISVSMFQRASSDFETTVVSLELSAIEFAWEIYMVHLLPSG